MEPNAMRSMHAASSRFCLALAGMALLMLTGPTAAFNQTHQTLPIQATVQVVAEIKSFTSPTSFTVDRASAIKGSVQIRNAASLEVYSNDPVGYQIRAAIVAPEVVSADIEGLTRNPVTVNAGGTLVPVSVTNNTANATTTFNLGFTFKLAPGTVEGTVIPWPIQFNIVPN